MTPFEEQLLPTAFVRGVTLEFTFAYMGSLMTFLAKGSETGGCVTYAVDDPERAIRAGASHASESSRRRANWRFRNTRVFLCPFANVSIGKPTLN